VLEVVGAGGGVDEVVGAAVVVVDELDDLIGRTAL
jgi:hypothetical protein